MKILSLVLAFSLASLLACTRSASEATPAPPTGPDTVSEIETWPWDSGWLSTGMNPQEKGRYIVGIGSTPSALFVLVNTDTLYGAEITQELWRNQGGKIWTQLPLPGKGATYHSQFRRIGGCLYFTSYDSGVYITDSLGNLTRRVRTPLDFNATNYISTIDSTSKGIVASLIARGGADTSWIVLITDSGMVDLKTRFVPRTFAPHRILESSFGKILVGTQTLYTGNLNIQETYNFPSSLPYEDWQLFNVYSMVEYNGKIWTARNGRVILRLNAENLEYVDSINQFQHSDTFDLQRFSDRRGQFGGLLKYQDLLFICGQGGGPLDFNGVWVWNEKRQWFQHTPLLRRGVRFNVGNFFPTNGIEVWRDTLYAVTESSRGLLKRAISDIRRDLDRDTARWTP
jgi:hypothetical protein